uniref:Putative secreted protein n=1 Tax=Anopheles darlingi TaxID=43151 RepID=A0A2M4DSK0_ANODA
MHVTPGNHASPLLLLLVVSLPFPSSKQKHSLAAVPGGGHDLIWFVPSENFFTTTTRPISSAVEIAFRGFLCSRHTNACFHEKALQSESDSDRAGKIE